MAKDPYVDPRTGVLNNKLGIKDAARLASAERDLTRQRIAQLSTNPIKGNFDLKHLQAIHKHIFQDVYQWAGEVRTVNMAKGDSMFARADRIVPEGRKMFDALAKDNHLKGSFTEKFVERAAEHFANLNALHPFREGNGRAQRVFFEQMAKEAGKPLDLSSVPADQWITASIAAHNGDNRGLESSFKSGLAAGRDLAQGLDR